MLEQLQEIIDRVSWERWFERERQALDREHQQEAELEEYLRGPPPAFDPLQRFEPFE